MNYLISVHWVLIAAIWYFGNGVLHDVFVIINHKGGYNRELLRLLMDGHVLIFSGIILLVAYLMLLNQIPYAALVSLAVAVGMLVYCMMIFPFLKSIGTIAVTVMLIIVSIAAYMRLS